MSEDIPGLGDRLLRLPGQLLLALVNATAVLVIAACVLAILVLNRVDEAGERIAGAVTEAALTRLQVTPADLKARLEAIDERIDGLRAQLADPDRQDHWQVNDQLKDLNRNLAGIRAAAEGLGAAGPDVAAVAFNEAGDLVTRALFALRGCEAGEKPTDPAGMPAVGPSG
ncbi:hypothetical protein WNZ15_01430 [Roseibium sp. AS2]|uniref:hypothetical protein n=1 Tax=Roseibium sp. AS2 TaxID=3135781 RepID=UPI00316D37D7